MEDNKKPTQEEYPGNIYTTPRIKPPAQPQKQMPVKEEPEKKKGRVTEKKKSFGERIAENFLATDKEEIQDHIVYDFLIPGIKNVIEDIVHMILFGGRADSRIVRERGESRPRYVSYDKKYQTETKRRDDEYILKRGDRRPELVFNRKSDAEQVLSGLCEYIDDYGKVTLKDFYNIVTEVTEGDINIPTDYTMTRYGWTSMATSSVVAVRGGYLLRVPKAEVIER